MPPQSSPSHTDIHQGRPCRPTGTWFHDRSGVTSRGDLPRCLVQLRPTVRPAWRRTDACAHHGLPGLGFRCLNWRSPCLNPVDLPIPARRLFEALGRLSAAVASERFEEAVAAARQVIEADPAPA